MKAESLKEKTRQQQHRHIEERQIGGVAYSSEAPVLFFLGHRIAFVAARAALTNRAAITPTITMPVSASAAPKGQLPDPVELTSMILAIIAPAKATYQLGGDEVAGGGNAKIRMAASITPGIDSGRVMRRKAAQLPSPQDRRRLQQGAIDLLQADRDGKDGERRRGMGQRHHHREGIVEQQKAQRLVDQPNRSSPELITPLKPRMIFQAKTTA